MKKVETIFYPHLKICFCQFINIVVILYTIWNGMEGSYHFF